jgi:hypothetical protein
VICDFCLAPDPVWDYAADAGPALPNGPFTALAGDGFAACAVCAVLIEEQAWPILIAHIADMQPHNMPEGTVLDDGVVHYGDRDHRMQRAALAVVLFAEAYRPEVPRKRL